MTIANARMYSATPRVKDAWNRLLRWVLADAGLAWEVIDYAAPAPLNALWARDDLGLAMMCGLPFSQRAPQPQGRLGLFGLGPLGGQVPYLLVLQAEDEGRGLVVAEELVVPAVRAAGVRDGRCLAEPVQRRAGQQQRAPGDGRAKTGNLWLIARRLC